MLVEDKNDRTAIEAMIENPPSEAFALVDPVSVGVIVAGVLALQTGVLVRGQFGKVHFKIEKKPTRDSLLQSLVKTWIKFRGPA